MPVATLALAGGMACVKQALEGYCYSLRDVPGETPGTATETVALPVHTGTRAALPALRTPHESTGGQGCPRSIDDLLEVSDRQF